MTKPVTNVAASVRQRLQNEAKATGRPFQEVFEYYAMERFLYRLSRSAYAGRFVLKGALMFRAWGGLASRPTRDMDFLARMDNTVDAVVPVFREVCEVAVEPDGMAFDAGSVAGVVIKEEADYPGVRVSFVGTLVTSRVSMQADLGFSDVVTPAAVPTAYPVILDFPAPHLAGYTRETVVAEKFEAMVKLGALNSRMKDFYDVWFLARHYEFDGEVLAEAVSRTFSNRKTAVSQVPFALTPEFALTPGKEGQWKGFVRKGRLTDAPADLATVIRELGVFLLPLAGSVGQGGSFDVGWKDGGPWSKSPGPK